MKKRTVLLASGLLLIFISAGIVWKAGSRLSAPALRNIGPPPKHLPIKSLKIPGNSGEISAWAIDSPASKGLVILMHGVRADRRAMLGRAEFLFQNGYSVLLFDFQAHGESSGEKITFGWLESLDARAVLDFAREKYPACPIAIIASSMGGAACLLKDGPLKPDALILEAVYPSIEAATANRLEVYLGKFGRYLSPLLTWQIERRFHIPLNELRPITKIPQVRCPLMIISGEKDRRTTLSDTNRLYKAAPIPKKLWIVPEAEHTNLHAFSKAEYERRVIGFLEENLGH